MMEFPPPIEPQREVPYEATADAQPFEPLIGADRQGGARSPTPQIDERTRTFLADLEATTPRLYASRILIAACVSVFAWMVIRGTSFLNPSADELFRWGANFGPATVGGQWWRLIACTFLHGGVIHLAFNMLCLWSISTIAERLFGNVAFALIYLLAGVGGSIASIAWRPGVISVGASGAIFGVYGAVLGYLMVRRHALPPAIVQQVGKNAGSFVVYNVLAGMLIPVIDTAAHVGGLLTGMLAGMAMQRPIPVPKTWSLNPLRYALAGGIGLLLGIGGHIAAGRVAADPELGKWKPTTQQSAAVFNQFINESFVLVERVSQTESAIRNTMNELRNRQLTPAQAVGHLAPFDEADKVEQPNQPGDRKTEVTKDRGETFTRELAPDKAKWDADMAQIAQMRHELQQAERAIFAAASAFRRALRDDDPKTMKEFESRMEEYAAASQRFLALRESYLKENNLSMEK